MATRFGYTDKDGDLIEGTMAEIGVSPARVSQMATKALKQLKEVLEKEGVTP